MEEWGEVSEKSDVYSLGRTLAELWTGTLKGKLDDDGIEECSSLCSEQSQTNGRLAKTLEFLNWEGEAALEVERVLVHDHKVRDFVSLGLDEQCSCSNSPATNTF